MKHDIKSWNTASLIQEHVRISSHHALSCAPEAALATT
eukprot:CAMPEP_0202899222 /NCGR_PEP_ID=MMETSP1392-20130828/7512_1 /ASSEMBLY_ACC=CAM_ASM_000868 /TAXON_ID=225041 /ORGANISM="Chlamydomonas chlamydogama, Strain SAG 11-48b" /LENGTH=37 /DNA_ID= /DNA_START= /DNA_END= /DNA_ORIENTATION=